DVGRTPQLVDLRLYRGRVTKRLRAAAPCEVLHPLDIEIDEVLIKHAIRQVRAGVVRPAIVDGVQRVQSDKAYAHLVVGPADEIHQVGKIATAPIAVRTKPIETDGNSGCAAASSQVWIRPGAVGGHDVPYRCTFRAQADRDVVIPKREFYRELCL